MLTQADRTVKEPAEHLEAALRAGVRHVGFKDVGAPVEVLRSLTARIGEAGANSYLELVSPGREREIAAASMAVEIGVDCLLGGTRVSDVLPILDGQGIRYYPCPGRITGHPSVLEGSMDEVVTSARALVATAGVHGLDLLAYRGSVDGDRLVAAVCEAVDEPVIVAGSIDTRERIEVIRKAGAAAFTVGSAAFEGKFVADAPGLDRQLLAIQACLG